MRRFTLALLAMFAAVATLACATSGPVDALSDPLTETAPVAQVAAQSPDSAPDVGSSVGDRTPDFEMRLADGTLVKSASLLTESRPAFLFFFATW